MTSLVQIILNPILKRVFRDRTLSHHLDDASNIRSLNKANSEINSLALELLKVNEPINLSTQNSSHKFFNPKVYRSLLTSKICIEIDSSFTNREGNGRKWVLLNALGQIDSLSSLKTKLFKLVLILSFVAVVILFKLPLYIAVSGLVMAVIYEFKKAKDQYAAGSNFANKHCCQESLELIAQLMKDFQKKEIKIRNTTFLGFITHSPSGDRYLNFSYPSLSSTLSSIEERIVLKKQADAGFIFNSELQADGPYAP
jgi:hypothetical protein